MKIPVFLSRPQPHLKVQETFMAALTDRLIERGLEPLTLGVSTYDCDAPLVGIRRMMASSCGLISVALRRTHLATGASRAGADVTPYEEQPLSDVWLTSSYCQIEPAMAFQLGLPILILREKGVLAEGVLERGVTGLYLPEFEVERGTEFLESEECKQLLASWESHVRRVFELRGLPPKLY
ncbi:hypothetical protein [Brevundimonas vesicularis]|uniref:hypothetical protein n=1 Tax=Brevundimonas vesicularis TaxID=41276 RepID=UPI0028AD3DA6|nr:hypothetical protein [Brevundimonas vesicularis]